MAIYLIGEKIKDGVPLYILQSNGEQPFYMAKTIVKNEIKTGRMTLANAHLSENGRLVRNKNSINNSTSTNKTKITRNAMIRNMSFNDKANYYFNVLLKEKNLCDMSIFNVDELDVILCGSLWLEIGDRGTSTVDIMLQKNLYCFRCIKAVIDECIRRKYLTEQECKQWLLDSNNNGRICNQLSFADWIVKHNK